MNEVGIIGVFVFFSEILFVFILNYRGIDEIWIVSVENVYWKVDKCLLKSCLKELVKKFEIKNIWKKMKFLW